MAKAKKQRLSPEQIRMARGAFGLSQRKLAAVLGMNKETLSDIESGKQIPQIGTNRTLQEFFETKVIFVEAVRGEHGRGVMMRWGVHLLSEGDPGPDEATETSVRAKARLRAYVEDDPDSLRTMPEDVRAALFELVEVAVPEVILPAAE